MNGATLPARGVTGGRLAAAAAPLPPPAIMLAAAAVLMAQKSILVLDMISLPFVRAQPIGIRCRSRSILTYRAELVHLGSNAKAEVIKYESQDIGLVLAIFGD